MRVTGGQTWLVVGVVIGAALGGACKRKAAVVPAEPVPLKLRPEPPLLDLTPTPPLNLEGVKQDWRSLMEAGGLARYAPAVAKMVRPAVQLKTRKVPASALAIGQSRIGGVPDLPARFQWPTYQGKHLAFIAQINLADVARVMPDGPLPQKGQLWFFYAWDQEHWGFDPKDAGSAVVHYEADAKLARRALPGDIPEEGRFASCAVGFRAYDDIPDGSDDRVLPSNADEPTLLHYIEVRTRVASTTGTSHKLLGHPEPVQNPMEIECAAVTNGIYFGDAKADESPRYRQADATKYDWRLLMQVDSDDDADMMWGDSGMIYFWIRDQDLRARRFDKTWMLLQCG
jgi:uncharacterized protein YwqG